MARLGASARTCAGSNAGRSRPITRSHDHERGQGRPGRPGGCARRRHLGDPGWGRGESPGDDGAAPRTGGGRTTDRVAAAAGRQTPVDCPDGCCPAIRMIRVGSRLRVAVLASDAAAWTRLRELVVLSGHQVVELDTGPDAILTNGTIDDSIPGPAVAIGSVEGDVAGRLPLDASAEQVDAALRAVAAGLTVYGPRPRSHAFS